MIKKFNLILLLSFFGLIQKVEAADKAQKLSSEACQVLKKKINFLCSIIHTDYSYKGYFGEYASRRWKEKYGASCCDQYLPSVIEQAIENDKRAKELQDLLNKCKQCNAPFTKLNGQLALYRLNAPKRCIPKLEAYNKGKEELEKNAK